MTLHKTLTIATTTLFLSGWLALTAFAQDLWSSLSKEAEEAFQAADAARANVLAPKNYRQASQYYRRAQDKVKRGKSIESIREDLTQTVEYLEKATESTKLAELTLTAAIQARRDALTAEAPDFAKEQWQQAERTFEQAASRLEDGDVNSARSRGEQARSQYREAELSAIQTNYLDETRTLIARAKQERVDKYAPKTLQRAEELLAQAEKALKESRYDTDYPRSLGQQAKYEANHALSLARELRPVRDKKMTLEEFALTREEPIAQIAGSLDIVAELDEGYSKPMAAIIGRIEDLQKASYELSDRRQQIFALEREIEDLQRKLGIESERLVQKQVTQVESRFNRTEAQVYTQSGKVLIRLVGLNFASGSALIETQYFGLLRKVQEAIRVFPERLVVVEGHTDSFGSDKTNLALSRKRADAVREYLIANMPDLDPASVEAVGYGESRPVAINATPEGRKKNRRIDIVIRPGTRGA